MQLPSEAWDTIQIDGADCLGCFYQREKVVFGKNGNEKFSAVCWIEIPSCQCPECVIFCGSEIVVGNRTFLADEPGTPDNLDCVKWYVTERCDPCG